MEINATSDVTPIYSGKRKKISCLNKFILINKIVEEEHSKSGLMLSAKDMDGIRYKKAEVVSVGALVTPNTIQDGDIILYDGVVGHQIKINDEIFNLIQEKDVVACLPH